MEYNKGFMQCADMREASVHCVLNSFLLVFVLCNELRNTPLTTSSQPETYAVYNMCTRILHLIIYYDRL